MNVYDSLKVGVFLLLCFEQGSSFVLNHPAVIKERKIPLVERLKESDIAQYSGSEASGGVSGSAVPVPNCDCF